MPLSIARSMMKTQPYCNDAHDNHSDQNNQDEQTFFQLPTPDER